MPGMVVRLPFLFSDDLPVLTTRPAPKASDMLRLTDEVVDEASLLHQNNDQEWEQES